MDSSKTGGGDADDEVGGLTSIPELTVDDVAARLGEPDFFVFDNNGRGRWKRSHVPGATQLNPYAFEIGDLPTNRDATLVFYCAGPG